jgi:predicted AlkP superfamily phosphohydrolase/phosphomutase/tetratricopeptide (TPR) repeat protein
MPPVDPSDNAASPSRRKVLLVGWDAADWKVVSPLVDAGHLPNLARLIGRGVVGNLATIQPILSPMLWTSIATGKRAYKHGIHGFSEPDPQTGRLRPITNLSRTTRAIWNLLHLNGLKSHIVGWWPSHPAEPIRGSMVSNQFQTAMAPLGQPWPIRPGTVFPAELAPELASLRIHPHELDGDFLRHFVPRAPEVDQKKDRRLESIAKIVAECTSIHAAATHLMQWDRDWDFCAVYYDAIDHFGHGFMKYHPPRLEWVSEADFNLYQEVIRAGYVWHDLMLGTLCQLAGPETTVVVMSDHGFHSDHLRPRVLPNEPAGPAAEHRAFGMFVAAGPGLRVDAVIHGAQILDITPTLLSLFNLPVGRDMDGRVLTQIYATAPKVEYVDSWDAVPGQDGRHPPETRLSTTESEAAIQQLVDLGYIEAPDPDLNQARAKTVRELKYNLARAHLDGGQVAEAAILFESLWNEWPEESRFGVHLLQTWLADHRPFEARDTLVRLRERKRLAKENAAAEWAECLQALLEKQVKDGTALPAGAEGGSPSVDFGRLPDDERRRLHRLQARSGQNQAAFAFLEGRVLALEGQLPEALTSYRQALQVQNTNRTAVLAEIGECQLRQHNWQEANATFEELLTLDPVNPQARFGLARAAMGRKDHARAVAEVFASLGLRYHHPQAHYLAAQTLWRIGRFSEVEGSLLRALEQNPVFPAAHALLARYLSRIKREYARAAVHRELARESARRIRQHSAGLPRGSRHWVEHTQALAADALKADPQSKPNVLPPRDQCITLVSGLPRSGTSMLMQLLAAGGVPILSDDQRGADDNNPRGYLELAAAKNIARDSTWLDDALGRAVKLIAQLLPHLPLHHRYRVIFMHRPLAEVAASQRRMLQRLGKPGAGLTDEALQEVFSRQVLEVQAWLRHHQKLGILDVLHLKYHETVQDPTSAAARIAGFLGGSFDSAAAAQAVDPSLWRERQATKAVPPIA